MAKEMVIATSPHETKVALLEDGQVVEVYVEREKEFGLVGSIYKGRVTRVLPGMQSAFVDVGLERDGFLYVSDFFEDLEEYDRDLATAVTEEPDVEPEPPAEAPADEAPAAPDAEAAPEPAAAPPDAQPAEPQPEEDRQPDFVHHEPPLRLPERRPEGRPRGRGGRRRHRGGRGRRFRGPDRGPMDRGPMDRGPMDRGPRREPYRPAPPAGDYEPIILPGESLAKYRGRAPDVPVPAERESMPTDSAEPGAEAHRGWVETVPVEEPAATEVHSAEPVELVEEAPALAPAPEEHVQPQVEESSGAAPASPQTERAPEAESTESYPEATTLAEIERHERSDDRVGLPPSVRDRTAGGVEWSRGRGRSDRGGRDRGGRGRRGRGPRPFGRRGGRARRGREERRPAGGRPSGGRPRMGHARPSRGQPVISELLRAGQEIIIQIAKEQMGKKGARITSHVTLPGRYLVYMPTIEHVGVSRKIGTAEERARLRRILLELKGTITGGFVVRTAATGCSEEDLRQDIDYLVKLWHDIRVKAEEGPAPALLHRDLGLVERLLRDHFTQEYESVWLDSEEEYAKVVEFVGGFQPALAHRIKLYTKEAPIFDELGVQREIDRALQPKVWLKSGGYIVINHTEALVAIDVNTGKYVGKGSTRLEDTIVKTNLDAIKEIVRQIRLRDLGGIIIIDFIDMEDRRNRHRVMSALEDALRVDRSPSKVLAFNEFGLVAITRKRSRLPLERLLCQPCPTCVGTGMVKSIPTLCYEIQGEARKMAHTIDAPELTIRANPEIVKALKARESNLVRELEEQTGKTIILQPDVTLHFEQYTIY